MRLFLSPAYSFFFSKESALSVTEFLSRRLIFQSAFLVHPLKAYVVMRIADVEDMRDPINTTKKGHEEVRK